jgi:5'-nucleotidase
LVVAPDRPWSGGDHTLPPEPSGRARYAWRKVGGMSVVAHTIDASPALAVAHAVTELAPRTPSLVVSGIKHGATLGTEGTTSGMIGAALEAAAFGIPALVVSQELDSMERQAGASTCDFAAAVAVTRRIARLILRVALPADVDVLSINIPCTATPETPWGLTRLSRRRYFVPQVTDRQTGDGRPVPRQIEDAQEAEEGSDVRAVKVEGRISVTPLSFDLTVHAAFTGLSARLGVPPPLVPDPWSQMLDLPEGSLAI